MVALFRPISGPLLQAVNRCRDTLPVPSWYRDPDAPPPNRPRKVGVCFIVELDGGVLIDRRSDDGALAFTGGTLEDDEHLLAGLARELREETGLEAGRTTFVGLFSDPTRLIGYDDGSIWPLLTVAFAVEPVAGARPRISEESLELRVVSRDELRYLALTPAHRPIRDAYLAFDGTPVIA
jgi:8-oxo-dGTP pyrophosphatase MutT (NUDIX family)